ncbi:MAG TPA: hypothetical protein VFA29_14735 [Candidatus Baltobacteraceae bacterium]|nr:hypothetical protein [Candidatus Baltobacteraceae bacterium]
MIRAVISIGTNSTRLLVADLGAHPPRPVLARSIGTRVGEGLRETGLIQDAAMQRTLDAVREHAAAARPLTDSIAAIATSAVRRAGNAAEFADRVREIAGCPLQVVSGEDEARYSYSGAVSGLDAGPDERVGVADPGGGSTEFAVGRGERAEQVVSCEIGAVRLTERVLVLAGDRGEITDADLQTARAAASAALEPLAAFDRVERLVFVGGTATTAVWLMSGSRDPFEYSAFTRSAVDQLAARLRALDLPARKTLAGMNPQRADILLAGLIIVAAVFERTGHESAAVSTNDLLMGYLVARERKR